MSLKNDRILHWLEAGAQPSDTVRSLLSKEGIMLALHMRRKEKIRRRNYSSRNSPSGCTR